jgi:TatD DNase family protein
MKLPIVDTHAHLDMDAFNQDRSEVIAQALDSGVRKIVTVGTSLQSSRKASKLAEDHQEVMAAMGFHPHGANTVTQEDVASLAEMGQHPKVVAIGEMGLDFYRNLSPREAQLRVFEWQLELAAKLDLPVVIHCRQAEKSMMSALPNWALTRKERSQTPIGVIHCFMGDMDTARQYLDMGFFLSLGAYIGYPASRSRHDVVRAIPLDRLVVETDSPFLPPQKLRGQRNEPAYLTLTIDLLAEIRQESPERIAYETTENACSLFRLSQ